MNKKSSQRPKTLIKWMEVSINKLNIVYDKDVGRCVDMIILGILDGLCVHDIDGGNNIPFWNTQSLKD